jgi:hypothetical protein
VSGQRGRRRAARRTWRAGGSAQRVCGEKSSSLGPGVGGGDGTHTTSALTYCRHKHRPQFLKHILDFFNVTVERTDAVNYWETAHRRPPSGANLGRFDSRRLLRV